MFVKPVFEIIRKVLNDLKRDLGICLELGGYLYRVSLKNCAVGV